jgi:hypothetical protein
MNEYINLLFSSCFATNYYRKKKNHNIPKQNKKIEIEMKVIKRNKNKIIYKNNLSTIYEE